MPPTDGDIADRFADELTRFRADHPDIRYVDGFIVDVNGHARGKRVPIDQAAKLGTGIPLCAAVLFLDPRGLTHDAGGMGISDGDPDILIRAVPGTLVPVPWSPVPLAQVLMEYRLPQGGPYPLEPRHVMAGVIRRLAGAGLTPVVAYEAEFFLFDPAPGTDGALQPPRNPLTGQRLTEGQVYGLDQVEAFETLLDAIDRACRVQGVGAGTAISEYGVGQYEVNLTHRADALRAADECAMFLRIVRRVAVRHGVRASFAAKPYPDDVGSGLHLHISLKDRAGRAVFGTEPETLSHAIGGILDTFGEAMALYAPHRNSYRRLAPDCFVPVNRSWGWDNRSTALRVPLGGGEHRRIEHRMAGADANPYLVGAAALAGLHHGLDSRIDPPPATMGDACQTADPDLPLRWPEALAAMKAATVLPPRLGEDFWRMYRLMKEAELEAEQEDPGRSGLPTTTL